MSIVHTLRGCHAWALGSKELGPNAVVTVKAGTKLKLRVSCPMDFAIRQVAGPRIALGDPKLYAGSTRVLVFKKAGLYRFTGTNLQTSDEVGLETLGDDNSLKLAIRVKS